MTKGEAHKIIDAELLKLAENHRYESEYGVPFYNVHDTGTSIDLVFHDKNIGDISVEYVPVAPYVFNKFEPVEREMPEIWEATL
jgi:hypothetical protein